jgi:phospholipase C
MRVRTSLVGLPLLAAVASCGGAKSAPSSESTAQVAAALAPQGDTDHDAPTTTPIKHVVVIFQENISFDRYFGTYPQAANPPGEPAFHARRHTPKVNGYTQDLLTNNPNKNAAGTQINPFRLPRSSQITCSQDHDYTDEQTAEDGGKMDQFVTVAFVNGHTGAGCAPDGSTVMSYVDGNVVTALWNWAQYNAMSDNSFNTTFGPSTPGVLNLVSGQTHGVTQELTLGNTAGDVTFDPATHIGSVTGDPDPLFDDCGSPDQAGLPDTNRNVGDLLNDQGITWGWFQGGFAPTTPATFDASGNVISPAVCGATTPGHPGVNPENPADPVHAPISAYSAHHNPFEYYQHSSNPHHLPPSSPDLIGKTDQANHQYDLSDFWTALDSGNLPAVSYLKAARAMDGHAGNSDPLSEQIFLVDTINRLQQSAEWPEMAVFIAWDDSDGFYDHQPAPIVNGSALSVDTYNGPSKCGVAIPGGFQGRCGYGPRLPLLAVSPWARKNHVDHTLTDQSSVLRFIERNWRLGFIDGASPPPAGQDSFDRIAGSLDGLFDFDRAPRLRPLVLDPLTGTIVDGADGEGADDDSHLDD